MDSSNIEDGTPSQRPPKLPRTLSNKDPKVSRVVQEVVRIEQRLSQTQDNSDDISSWISEPSRPFVDPNLPLTPPCLLHDGEDKRVKENDTEREAEGAQDDPRDTAAMQDAQRNQTPVAQRSPPTPDQTPPRQGEYPRLGLKARPTPPPSNRQLSSAAQSFTTAQEQLYSQESLALMPDHEKEGLETPRPGHIALGLGVAASEGSGTPTVRTPSAVPKMLDLDNSWDGGTVPDDPFVAPESVAVQEVQDHTKSWRSRRHEVSEEGKAASISEDFQDPLVRDSAEGSCITAERIPLPTSPTQNLATHEQSPVESDDTSIIHVDKKRLSAMSNQSQIVQARIVSTPPQRRQRLRHSSKTESLRSASEPQHGSNRSSLASNEAKPRLHHQRARITERGNRASVNTDSGISMGSDLPKQAERSLPPLEIPQRHSSLRASKQKIDNLRQMAEMGDVDHSRRPGTAPETSHRRELSSSGRNTRARSKARAVDSAKEKWGRRSSMAEPVIPPRSSSLSAPTSRNGSRTTSLTSTSLHKHNLEQQQQQQQQRLIPQVELIPPSQERQIGDIRAEGSEEKCASDELSRGRQRSLLATPFSTISMQSSTPGPYEVNEATAINIYPHNNTSVLVVQQLPQHGVEQPRLSASLSANVRINLGSFGSPVRSPISGQVMESPLKNPRQAPQPPPVVLIQTGPAQSDPAALLRGRISDASTTSAFKLVRRALSARRYSESFVNPLSRPYASRSNSTKQSNRTKIHPESKPAEASGFRRPRGFWNDLSDDEDDQRRAGFIRTSIRGPVDLGNSSIGRRLGSFKIRRKPVSAANESDGTYVSYGPARARRIYPTNEHKGAYENYESLERKVGIVTRIRNTPRPRPFATLQEAIKDMRQKRVEEQLEKQRERLRQNIGPVILQQDARPFY